MTRRKWTEEEINMVKKWYHEHPDELNLNGLSLIIDRHPTVICTKARALGLTRLGRKPKKTLEALHKANKDFFGTEEGKAIREECIKKLNYVVKNNHPRGYLGKNHSKEFSEQLSIRSKNQWKALSEKEKELIIDKRIKSRIANGTLNPLNNQKNPYSRARGGRRKDLGNIYFRSSWEANMARYYNYVGIKWQYEPREFIFESIKRGCLSYRPDFYLPDEDRWVEVKGWMDKKSKTKLKRFEKYYPEEYAKLEIIGEKEYKAFEKYSRLISNWE